MPGDQIRCPKCWARPCSSSAWACDGCNNSFNTFETRGRCPGCGKQFENTQCVSCHQWSPHTNWYQCIRCPKCWARPCSSSAWACDGCNNSFNTFETRGRCPGCNKQFENTQCVSCFQRSPHAHWYQLIRCPKCQYHPCNEDKWSCHCGHSWNTFETRGQCPSCKHQWMDTQCTSCGQKSTHLDWYEGH